MVLLSHELGEKLDYFIENFPYDYHSIIPVDIIYEVGKYIVINMNRAMDCEPFERYLNPRLNIPFVFSINKLLRDFYNFASRNDAQLLDGLALMVHEKTCKKVIK